MLVTMKPMRGISSSSCHSTLAMTRRELFQDAARYEKLWKKTFGFLEGLPTGRVVRWSISWWRLVDVGGGEGRVSPQVEFLIHLLVPVHYGGEELPPAVSRVDVAGPQDRPLAVTEIVEAEERMVAGRFEEAIVGRAFLVSVDG